jgi:hypothetical protein
MRAPFLSEGEGYEFVLLTVIAFSAIAVASLLGGAWAGVPVWAVVTVAALALYARRGSARRGLMTAPPHVGPKRHVLAVALEPPAAEAVSEIRHGVTVPRSEVLVLCPAHVSPLHHWTSDVDAGMREASRTLDESLLRLRGAGIEARGEVGDDDPLQAIEDALRTFGADEIVILSGPGPDGQALAAAAEERFAVPIRHLAADGLEARRPTLVQSL